VFKRTLSGSVVLLSGQNLNRFIMSRLSLNLRIFIEGLSTNIRILLSDL
jgi:hypothetical protein